MQILVFGLVGAGVLLVGGAFVSSLLLNSYLHSDAFRNLLGRKTSSFFHAEGQYMPFRWSGFSVYSDGYLARGKSGIPFTEMRADQIRAEFYPQGMFHRAWQINDLEIQRFQVAFDNPAAPVSAGHVAESPQPLDEPRRPLWAPDRLDLRKVLIHETNLSWSPTGGAGSLQQVRTTIVPDGRAWVLSGTGGQLRQAGWPVLNVDHLNLRYQHPELFITDGQLKLGESENLQITGQVNLEKNSSLDLLIKASGISITPFLPEDWRARLKGNVISDARLSGTLGNAESLKAVGTLNLVSGQLEALPVLDRIATFTRTEQFRQFTLQKASAEFVWTKPKLRVSRLVLESEGLIRIEGSFVVEEKNLDGVFQVGVTPTSLRWLPGSQTRVFTVERDGYVWTAVRVNGPLDDLKEDLSPRLIAAAGTEVIDGIKGTVEQGAKEFLDLLKPLVP